MCKVGKLETRFNPNAQIWGIFAIKPNWVQEDAAAIFVAMESINTNTHG
jgi:hypothetical protein